MLMRMCCETTAGSSVGTVRWRKARPSTTNTRIWIPKTRSRWSRFESDLPKCRAEADIEAHDGETVVLVGRYEQADMNTYPRRGPEYVGLVGIQLENTRVHLGPTWDSASQRDDEEIERLEGEQVRAIGEIHEEMRKPLQEQFMFTGPCLHPVTQIEPIESPE